MNTLTIVDTDILIDAGQAVRKAIECLADIEQQSALAISVITQMEAIGRVSQQDRATTHRTVSTPFPGVEANRASL